MKRHWFCLLFTAGFFLSPLPGAAHTATQEFVTGQDWTEHMSVREKYMSLIPPAILFSEYDVHLKLALPQYIFLIDKVMLLNPQLQGEEMSSIFASTIYLFEPGNRPALKTMEMTYLKGNFEPPYLTTPTLTIEELLSEAAPTPSIQN